MTKALPILVALAAILILASALTAQTNNFVGPELLNTPSIFIPDEAELSGLGGLVRVRLSIDENGGITEVEQVSGPGWTCPQVSRPDVVAMRDSATKAALSGKFRAATLDGVPLRSSITLNFDFPAGDSKEEKAFSDAVSGAYPSAQSTRGSNTPPTTGAIIPAKRSDDLVAKHRVKHRNIPGMISGGVINGRAINLVKPVYPAAARDATGTVSVSALIDTNGEVFSAVVISGHPLLRFAAVSAACQSTFDPVIMGGNPIRVHGVITYNFIK